MPTKLSVNKNIKNKLIILFLFIDLGCPSSLQAKTHTSTGFSVFGQCKYPDDFKYFDYVNPEAPQGGEIVLGDNGSFDSLNPFIIKGTPPAGILLTVARLMEENRDAVGECYAYVAESMELDDDRRYVIFHLNPKACFSDGKFITADDVIWTFETLKTKGQLMYRTYFKNVTGVEKLSDHSVKFNLDGVKNPELPLVLGQLPVLPKHFYEKVPFDRTTLTPPPSSGPYAIEKLEAGHYIVYKRVKNWWGNDVPSQRGYYNFERIRYDFYLDSNTLFEAFKSGKVDIRQENVMKNWVTGYDIPAFKAGLIIRQELKHHRNSHTTGFFFNTRRPIFQDVRVREALTLAFDFNWANKHLFYSGYKRNESYYPNSCFVAKGLLDSEEKALLTPYKDKVPERLWTTEFKLPDDKNEQTTREVLKRSVDLLREAGWHIIKGKLVNDKTKKPFVFDLVIADKALEKVSLLFARNLKSLGITVNIKIPDTTAFTERVDHQDFDMLMSGIGQSDSLGNEQRDYFTSSRADLVGSRNFAGIKNPVVDELVEHLIQSPNYATLCSRGRALDRVLLWNFYMIPTWHKGADMLAYWDKFGRPKTVSKYYPYLVNTWWYDKNKALALDKRLEDFQNQSRWQRFNDWVKGLVGR